MIAYSTAAVIIACALVAPAHSGAASVACSMDAHGRGTELRGPRSLSVRCPSDHEDAAALQAAAEAALAALDLDLRYRAGLDYSVAEALVMERAAAGWRPALGQILIERAFNIPTISNLPANWMVCSAALRPAPDGVPRRADAVCLSDNDDRRVTARMEEALLEAIANTRFAPVSVEYCMNREYVGRVEIHHPFTGERWEDGGEMPDPEQLPRLCG